MVSDFGININPHFLCHFKKFSKKSLKKASKKDGNLTLNVGPMVGNCPLEN